MRNLTLSFSKVRHQYGDINYQVKSRFLNEIPKEYLHQVRQLATPKSAGFGISPFEFVNMQQEESQSQFKTGSFVTHPKFGIGVILKTEGQGDDLCYHIDFKAGGGRKVLLAKMAKLSKL
jgi:DNA helicase-2/ATP-dependent DNA helicase PcrA